MSMWKKYQPFWMILIVGVLLIVVSWVCQVWASLDVATVMFSVTALYWIVFAVVATYAEKMQENYAKHVRNQTRANTLRDQICHVSTQPSAEDHT